MMEDTKEGKFDLIVTLEVSRFIKNTVDTFQEIRKLKRSKLKYILLKIIFGHLMMKN